MDRVVQVVRGVRNLRAEVGLPPGKRVGLAIFSADAGVRGELEANREAIEALGRVDAMAVVSTAERPRDALVVPLEGLELYVPVLGVIDVVAEQQRLARDLEKVTRELGTVQAKLAKPAFVEQAPGEVVEKVRDREADLLQRSATLERGIDRLRELGRR
jgi:valyl-tRNA synthetase